MRPRIVLGNQESKGVGVVWFVRCEVRRRMYVGVVMRKSRNCVVVSIA